MNQPLGYEHEERTSWKEKLLQWNFETNNETQLDEVGCKCIVNVTVNLSHRLLENIREMPMVLKGASIL